MGFTTEHSAVNYTAVHHKPLFWRRLATKLSPLVVPQVCPLFLAYRWVASPFPRTPFRDNFRVADNTRTDCFCDRESV
jgi:hypothetical protein